MGLSSLHLTSLEPELRVIIGVLIVAHLAALVSAAAFFCMQQLRLRHTLIVPARMIALRVSGSSPSRGQSSILRKADHAAVGLYVFCAACRPLTGHHRMCHGRDIETLLIAAGSSSLKLNLVRTHLFATTRGIS